MTDQRELPPRLSAAMLRMLLPGDMGASVHEDLDREYSRLRSEKGRLYANAWYRTHLARPSTWTLSRALRSRSRRVTAQNPMGPAGRLGRQRPTLGFSLLDLKLGVRMLFKHPGLTIVGTLALSIAIATVASVHSFSTLFLSPHLPVPEGDRIVGIWNVDATDGRRAQQTLGDMLVWRDQLRSVEGLGAFATFERVLTVPGGETRAVRVAQISPSSLRVLRVAPHLGRLLADDEEEPGAPAVALLGYDLWRSGFAADSSIVGRVVRLGDAPHTVVGVMPDGFNFPINEQVWTAAAVPSTALDPGEGPPVTFTVGRLAPGATLEGVALELDGVGARLAEMRPATHGRLRPRIEPYTQSFLDADDPTLATVLRLLRVLIVVVLLVAAANVGALVYARTAARTGEISVRTALGASRRRIALQLFAEALVLAGLAGALGYGVASVILRRVMQLMASVQEGLPYWWDGEMSASTLLLVATLVALSAVLTGILPALGVTSRGVRSTLQRIGAGDSGLSFGRAASAVVVGQVAVSVTALMFVAVYLRPFLEDYAMDDGVARDEYLAAEIRQDQGLSLSDLGDDLSVRFERNAEIWRELGRRVSMEADVLDVTFGTSFPGTEHPVYVFQAQAVPPPYEGAPGHRSRVAWVEPGFFAAFDVRHLKGRVFDEADVTGPMAKTAVVNEAFARRILSGGESLGQLIRLGALEDDVAEEWVEIVGVVPDLTVDMGSEPGQWPAIYFPLVSNDRPVYMAVRIEDEPAQFTGRLHSVARALDPSMVIHRPRTLEDMAGAMVMVMYIIAMGVGLLVFAALVLSTAGVYSLMSFTVAQRTREIGIRCALGANHRRVARQVLSRALIQVSIGTAAGVTLGWAGTRGELTQGVGPLAGITAAMLVMGLIACGFPVRRALQVQPTEALQES